MTTETPRKCFRGQCAQCSGIDVITGAPCQCACHPTLVQRLRSGFALESDCLEAADAIERLQRELAARDKTIETLQRALSFWHPGVGGRDDDEFLTRAGDDAMLLFGYMGPHEKSACELGWIAVQDAARSEGGKP